MGRRPEDEFRPQNPKAPWRRMVPLIVVCVAVFAAFIGGAWAGRPSFELTRIDPPTLNHHPAYAQVTTVRGNARFVFVAGQVDRPIDYEHRSNRCQHDDWYGQYLGTMENVRRGLEAAGATWQDVVFIRRYITDWRAWRAMTKEHGASFPDYWEGQRPPPSTMIQVVGLSEPCQLIEIDVFAMVEDDAATP